MMTTIVASRIFRIPAQEKISREYPPRPILLYFTHLYLANNVVILRAKFAVAGRAPPVQEGGPKTKQAEDLFGLCYQFRRGGEGGRAKALYVDKRYKFVALNGCCCCEDDKDLTVYWTIP